jgi:Uma2 family endonuclease
MGEPAQRGLTFERAARRDPDREGGELDAGRWVPVTRNTWSHGKIMLAAGAILRDYARSQPGWSVAVGDPGAKLQHGPDTLRGPDVAIVRKEREPTGRGVDGWLDGAPDVAVEILGDAQSLSDVTKKALEYLAAGAGAVWVLDPEPRRVLVFTAPSGVRVLSEDDTLEEPTLPGFRCRVADLFAE